MIIKFFSFSVIVVLACFSSVAWAQVLPSCEEKFNVGVQSSENNSVDYSEIYRLGTHSIFVAQGGFNTSFSHSVLRFRFQSAQEKVVKFVPFKSLGDYLVFTQIEHGFRLYKWSPQSASLQLLRTETLSLAYAGSELVSSPLVDLYIADDKLYLLSSFHIWIFSRSDLEQNQYNLLDRKVVLSGHNLANPVRIAGFLPYGILSGDQLVSVRILRSSRGHIPYNTVASMNLLLNTVTVSDDTIKFDSSGIKYSNILRTNVQQSSLNNAVYAHSFADAGHHILSHNKLFSDLPDYPLSASFFTAADLEAELLIAYMKNASILYKKKQAICQFEQLSQVILFSSVDSSSIEYLHLEGLSADNKYVRLKFARNLIP